MAFDVGTVCVKIAGRDAGKKCVVVELLDDGFALIEGETRRRKVNLKHLEPTGSVEVKKGASHDAVMDARGLKAREVKKRESKPKPAAVRKAKPKTDKPAKKKAK